MFVPRLNPQSQLESSLKALANELAKNLVDAVLRGSLAELVALPSEGAVVRRGPGRPAGSPRAATPAASGPAPSAASTPASRGPRTAPSSSRAPRAPRAAVSLDGASRGQVLEALVSYLRTCPKGARAEELRSVLGLTRARFIQATRDGLSTEEIRKVGQLRATVYFAE